MKRWKAIYNALTYGALILGGISMIMPFLWMVATSLKLKDVTFAQTFPNPVRWENYIEAWTAVPFGRFFLNSLLVAVAVAFGRITTSALAAYAFARLKFRGRDALFVAYLATMMIPAQVTMIPLFILVTRFHWIDSYWALIIPGLASAYGCFLLRQFFMSIPSELEDAAKIDGCGHWRIFTTIMLPLSKPALATYGIFTLLGSWNDFMWPLLVIYKPSMKTLPIGLAALRGFYGDMNWSLIMAGAVIATIPVLILYLFAQRYFIEGITLTGMGGK